MSENGIDYGALGEDAIEHLCNLSFARDFVYRGPKYRRGREEKELCDVLVLVRDQAILFEVKTPDMQRAREWPRQKIERWCESKATEAFRQVRGGIAALQKRLVPNVANERQGVIPLGHSVPSRVHAVVAVHAPPWLQLTTRPPRIEVGQLRCEVVLLNFYELGQVLRELSTVGDLLDYLEMRERLVRRGPIWPGRELDMLAGYQTDFPRFEHAVSQGNQVLFANNVWSEYVRMEIRGRRDRANRPSFLIDALIDTLHRGRGYEPPELAGLETGSGTVVKGEYSPIAVELNLLRRIERRALGERVLEKFKLCDQTGRGRHFAHVSHEGVVFLFRISNEERRVRMERLNALTSIVARKHSPKRIVSLTFNSPGYGSGWSVDGTLLLPGPDPGEFTEKDEELYQRFFRPARAKTIADYPRSTKVPKRFKQRKKRR